MVGQVADNYGEQILQKNFNSLIRIDTKVVKREETNYQPIPQVYEFDDKEKVLENNRNRIYNDIQKILIECKINTK